MDLNSSLFGPKACASNLNPQLLLEAQPAGPGAPGAGTQADMERKESPLAVGEDGVRGQSCHSSGSRSNLGGIWATFSSLQSRSVLSSAVASNPMWLFK